MRSMWHDSERTEMNTWLQWRKLKERGRLEDLDVEGNYTKIGWRCVSCIHWNLVGTIGRLM